MDFKKLKSGSDVRGVAMGENAVLTPAVAQTLGRAFVAFLSQKLLKKPEQLTIAVGRDSRLSGPQLLGAVLEGITTTGATAADYEMCTTPSMYMAILTEGFQPGRLHHDYCQPSSMAAERPKVFYEGGRLGLP